MMKVNDVSIKYLRLIIIIVIILSSTHSNATEPITFKDWAVSSSEDYMYAVTMNNNNNALGHFCYYKTNKCYYIIGIDASSEDGQKYPALLNSDKGAKSIELIGGGKISDTFGYRYYINYDDINDIILNSNRVGFALPMNDDNFRAIRFSLDGSSDAIKFMLKVFNSSSKDNKNVNQRKKDSIAF